jgi:hypothetical protein
VSDSTAVARRYRGSRPTCDLYLPGHLVHWVQAKKASEHKFSWGRLEAVEEPIVTVRYLDRVGTYRTHDTAELAFYASIGDKISVCEPYGVLRYDIDDQRTLLVGVADADAPFEPCQYRPLERITPDVLAERIRSRGGFGVPAPGGPLAERAERAERAAGDR